MSTERMHQQANTDGEDLAGSLGLLQRAHTGDSAALNELLARYQDRVLRLARVRTGARLRRMLDSADIAQETLAVAACQLPQFRPRDHAAIIQWLAKILENQVRNAAAKQNAARRDPDHLVDLEQSSPHGGLDQLCASDTAPPDRVAKAELREIYDSCVEQLSPDHREVILLREVAGASWEAIAAELGRPTAHAAEELYRRASRRLAGLLRPRLSD